MNREKAFRDRDIGHGQATDLRTGCVGIIQTELKVAGTGVRNIATFKLTLVGERIPQRGAFGLGVGHTGN
ncbi:MAG: hypothetical protein K0B14_14470 [Anaerolineaceae bacterium]|nr:hypothetical protein [Anaerolineaceae bacterium]